MKRDSVILTNSGTCKEWFLITQEMASQTVHLNKKFHKSNIYLPHTNIFRSEEGNQFNQN